MLRWESTERRLKILSNLIQKNQPTSHFQIYACLKPGMSTVPIQVESLLSISAKVCELRVHTGALSNRLTESREFRRRLPDRTARPQ